MNIVLVHGLWDKGRIYRRMSTQLAAKGHQCYAPDLRPANAKDGLVPLAVQLEAYIKGHVSGDSPIAVVGFSMGALIARHFIQHLGGHTRTRYFFSISGPHKGTLSAHLWHGKAAQDMRLSSRFLQKLNCDLSAFNEIEVHSYRTPFDLLILPSKSSCLSWGENHIIPTLFHHRMVVQNTLIKHIAEQVID